MTLMAQVEQARNRHQESNQQLLAASGVVKGLYFGRAAVEGLVENLRLSRAATSIERKVRSAQNAQRNLPSAPGKKVYAGAEGRKPILSGEGRPDLINAVEARAARMNPELFRPVGGPDNGVPGRHNFTHAEKMASEAYPNKPLGVSKAMCDGSKGNCLTYFQDLAEHHGKVQVVADPEKTRIFHPNSQIDELANDISKEELSKSAKKAATEGLENIPIRGATKALGPIGIALDVYSLKEAWDADGGKVGENVISTSGGVAGGLAGAAAGAAIGSAIFPVGGTVIGGVIGGVIGSGAGSAIAEGIGSLFD